jgi:KDO2-lipid IV(A) lauroyltransferase
MADLSYAYRPSALLAERLYTLSPDGLAWTASGRQGFLRYSDVERVRFFKRRFLGSSATYWTCVLSPRAGGKLTLGAANRVGFNTIEDRTSAYMPFIRELETRLVAANPQLRPDGSDHWLSKVETIAGRIGIWLFLALRRLNVRRLPDAGAWTMRKIGPWMRGHRTARAQLTSAFPEKSTAEIETILTGMWDHFARLGTDYLDLGKLTGDEPGNPERSRILIDPQNAERLRRLRDARQPALLFTGHFGNWELTATTVSALGTDLAVVYRAPKSGPIADELVKTRTAVINDTIEAGPDTPQRIRHLLKRGWMVGMLIDQYYADGIEVMLFNRPTKVNPLFARFIRLFDCPVYGFRVIRLPEGRFRFEMTEQIDLPRDAHGRVDVRATTQLLMSIIEGWVREYPEQWMWLHRHWR